MSKLCTKISGTWNPPQHPLSAAIGSPGRTPAPHKGGLVNRAVILDEEKGGGGTEGGAWSPPVAFPEGRGPTGAVGMSGEQSLRRRGGRRRKEGFGTVPWGKKKKHNPCLCTLNVMVGPEHPGFHDRRGGPREMDGARKLDQASSSSVPSSSSSSSSPSSSPADPPLREERGGGCPGWGGFRCMSVTFVQVGDTIAKESPAIVFGDKTCNSLTKATKMV